jgi:type IV pilus assembly protein PilO
LNELLDRILALPRQRKMGVLAGLVVALLALGYFLLYSPQAVKIAQLSDNIENVEKERNKKRKLAANLPKLQQQLQQLDGSLKLAIAQLPDRKEIPDLLSNISTKAREARLEILIFRPRGENFQEFYAEIPVDIVVRGGFHELVAFFDEVARLNRLVNIHNIEIRNPRIQGSRVLLDGSTMATTFRFLDEEERKKIAAERAKKDKR